MSKTGSIYFVSDLHLGTPNYDASFTREKKFVGWLNEISEDAKALYLVGDIFDFWFDYKHVVPKGFVRVLGKLAELSDNGIEIHYFKGNHDMWLNGYFEKEIGCKIHGDGHLIEENGIKIYVAHGDGKGPKDYKYKFLKKVFRSPLCNWLFGWIHPNIGMGIAQYWSRRSRYGQGEKKETFYGEDNEWLVQYVKRKKEEIPANYFIFGHRHLPLDIDIDEKTKYINLGDWLHYFSYAKFDGKRMELCYYKD